MNLNLQIDLQNTYLYKLHILANELDKAFHEALMGGSGITLSQFLLLAIISDSEHINQRRIAKKLGISPAAINRQTDIAIRKGLVRVNAEIKKPSLNLKLTDKGYALLAASVDVLEVKVFGVFANSDRRTDLMAHIDMLLEALKKEVQMETQIPKAQKLFKGDINIAVIAVQKATGISISPDWWDRNVGNSGTSHDILARFDKAYARDFGQKIASKK
jgi:DNA-binding MarR family transcriptional regulator